MNKLALVLVASLVASPALAQTRAQTASAVNWSGPVGGALAAAGLTRVSSLGSVSLPRLATPNDDDTLPVFAQPQLILPLAAELKARGLTPDTLNAIHPLETRLAVVGEAAKAVERRAASEATGLAGLSQKTVEDEGALLRLETSARELRENAIYLGAGAEAALARAERAVAGHRDARQKALKAFYDDLPKTLAESSFRVDDLIAPATRVGRTHWRGIDGEPDEAVAGAVDVVAARVDSIESMPQGPWTYRQHAMIGASVRRAMWLDGPGTLEDVARATVLLRRSQAALERIPDAEVAASSRRLLAGGSRISDIERLESHYETALAAAKNWREKAHVLAGAWAGSPAFPSWAVLQEKRRAIAARMEKIGVIGGPRWALALFPLLLASLLSDAGALPAWALAAVVAPPILMMWATFRRTRAEIPDHRELHLLMTRHWRNR